MKSRILRDLHKMANRVDIKYIKKMEEKTGKHENDLPAIASETLACLLHDYSHFSVTTIDSFFQKVIRSFAREMGLYAGYIVELDQNSVLDEATNLMLNDIDQNDFLKDWLVEWAKRKIEEGKSWNIKSDVMQLGREIFSEELQNMDPKLLMETTNKESLNRFQLKLQRIVDNYWDSLQHYGQQAVAIITNYGLYPDSFKRKGSGVGAYFFKLSRRQEAIVHTYIKQALESVEGWYSKDSQDITAIRDAYENGLGEILQETVSYQNDHAQKVATAGIILKQINVLGVLCDLMRYVTEYTRNQNLFLISEASGFLKTIIANADAPFIYERVGNFYNHFMIDEFQDTSGIQWDNFRPLIANSIASGHSDWIVGDVKQSIYRWRNTDWKILSEEAERDLGSHNVCVQNLDKNWRSTPEIVHFNNAFFREAVLQMCMNFLNNEADVAGEEYLHSLANSMTEAYRDGFQHLPDRQMNETGYVHLSMITEEKGEEETWRDKALNELPRRIEALQELGYALSDIAILVRENREAHEIADMLLAYRQSHPDSKYRYDVLSNESLLIGNSPVVKWLVAAMRYIVEPDDLINRAYLQHEYDTYFNSENSSGSVTQSIHHSQFQSLPVYELSDRLIQQYDLYQNVGQAPFLQAFQDILLQYTRREATDIRSFLDWWEDEKEKKCVAMPDNQDAIRLITIHKSKGLEFDAVIIPFCDWALCKSGKTLWCQPGEEPFNDMKLIPLKFEKELRNTIFVKEYLREKMLSYIDNLNLLYVAFTRARKALFISTPLQQGNDDFGNVKNLFHNIFNNPLSPTLIKYIDLKNFWSPENSCFELGVLTEKESRKKETHDKPSPHTFNFQLSIINYQFTYPHITRNSAYFTIDSARSAQIDKGKLLHDIFRTIVTINDLEHCLNTMITEGKLSETERIHIIDMVFHALGNPVVSRWFAPGRQVKTEAEILLPDGSIARPDRIVFDNHQVQVIDYKFGTFESKKYRQQVLCYTDHLRKMGYASVKGFLWYVALDQVVEV